MRVVYHPEFPGDINRYAAGYGAVSPQLEQRFRQEVDHAIAQVIAGPTHAGHLLYAGSRIVRDIRRRNLVSFPFFILYGLHSELLIFGSVIPSRSDPLTRLARFGR
jgi:hypothetical protein